MKRNSSAAFTLIEMLVVIAIIAVLAAFAVPALTQALSRGQMTGTMNNARQLQLAGFQMATDGATNSDGNLSWPGNDPNVASLTLEQYCSKLVQNDYLKAGDLQKILTAPGANCVVTPTTTGGVTTVTLTGTRSGLKVYKVTDADPSNTIFVTTLNYVYDTLLTSTYSPYGDKGFVVVRKGGDAAIFRKNQASAANFPNGNAFVAAVGKLTGTAEGAAPAAGDGTGTTLTYGTP